MRNKGFTLIELLAVIVILAIIALIAVPIVINIINDSKKESINRSIELYIDHAQKMIAKEQMKDPTFNPSECEIKPEGILECKNETKTYSPIKIEMKGQMPKSGKIKFSKGMVVEGVNLELDNLYYKVSEGTKEQVVSYSDYITRKEDTGTSGLSVGDKYDYEVSPGVIRTFYVLSIEGEKVNLIMNSNICNDGTPADKDHRCNYAWHWLTHEWDDDNNNFGPDIAMTNLYNATKNWTNVPDMIMNYEDENNKTDSTKGYTGITTENGVTTITGKNGATNTTIGTAELPLKARLPKESEVTSQEAGCHVYSSIVDYGTCSTWLVENLVYKNVSSYPGSGNTDKYNEINRNNGITNIFGYWLLSSTPGTSNIARDVYYDGTVDGDSTSYAGFSGLRAVITVSKSDLS